MNAESLPSAGDLGRIHFVYLIDESSPRNLVDKDKNLASCSTQQGFRVSGREFKWLAEGVTSVVRVDRIIMANSDMGSHDRHAALSQTCRHIIVVCAAYFLPTSSKGAPALIQ